MNIGIIGAGLVGKKRAANLPSDFNLLYICDTDQNKARILAKQYNCKTTIKWPSLVNNPLIEALIISTPNNLLVPIAVAAINKDKHVLIEKPGAKNLKEFQKIISAKNIHRVVAMVGYNHRYHPSIIKAKKMIDSNKYGQIHFLRGVYGHGGRLGYEKEWRFNPEIAGGGELLDQGSHLIDLVNYFCGQMEYSIGIVSNMFWKSTLEDVSFVLLKNKKGQIAQLSATALEWKNKFSLEIILERAKIQINGLGRSYGREKLILFEMKKEMGIPKAVETEFPEEDDSWYKENCQFIKRIKIKDYSDKSIQDAKYVLETIDKIYHFSNKIKI